MLKNLNLIALNKMKMRVHKKTNKLMIIQKNPKKVNKKKNLKRIVKKENLKMVAKKKNLILKIQIVKRPTKNKKILKKPRI
jgi:hypothetical protein